MVDQLIGLRAGFWRRALACTIDSIIVGLPFQVVAAILFAATSGWIHMSSGAVAYRSCVVVQQVPDALAPPAPTGANSARECRVFSFFGMETARILKVGRVTKNGAITTSAWRSYMLDTEGHPINGVSIDWFAMAAFVAYVIAMETRTGTTLGDRAIRIRVLDAAAADASGVPLRKIMVRYLALCIGFAPMFAILLIYGDVDAIAASGFVTWLILAAILGFGWVFVNFVLIVGPLDPLYDRIAGTAVVRVQAPLEGAQHNSSRPQNRAQSHQAGNRWTVLGMLCLVIAACGSWALFYLKHVQDRNLNPAAEITVLPVEKQTAAAAVDQQHVVSPVEQQTAPPSVQQPNAATPEDQPSKTASPGKQIVFNEAHVRQLANRLKIQLPRRLAVMAPSSSAPTRPANFVGAWVRTSPGKVRDSILIIEDVDQTGIATGIYAVGPPKFYFLRKNAQSYTAFTAPVTGDGVSFMWGPLKFTFNRFPGDLMWGHVHGMDPQSWNFTILFQRIE